MSASLCSAFGSMQLSQRRSSLAFKANVAGQQLVARPRSSVAPAAVFVVEAKQNSLKRQRTAETARMANKSRKSEIATRMKKARGAGLGAGLRVQGIGHGRKRGVRLGWRCAAAAQRPNAVFAALDAFKSAPPASEADLAPVQKLINEAYQVIDKAVGKGVLHSNTGARRKARLAAARRNLLVAAGLYTPA
eukprot:scaffold22.g6078.t1